MTDTANRPRPVRRALLSVSDKTGLLELGRTLAALDVEILSTGGTAKALQEAGIAVREVAEHTQFPEMMDGRVKTLHPKIHGGLLALRDNAEHVAAMRAHDIGAIDMLVVNLYPFEATVAKGAAAEDCIENIDIGGPAMIRSAAKNHGDVVVVVDPEDYAEVIAALQDQGGSTGLELRRALAAKAFARTAAYDAAIAQWFADQAETLFAPTITVSARRAAMLRYGENPHQHAALYLTGPARPGVATATQVQGKELSYNNLNDTDAAFELVSEFDPATPAVAIIKHANPCGVAIGADLRDAYVKALACDPVSAFGGIIALNQILDEAAASEIAKIFTEVVIAPDATAGARAVMAAKKNLRLLLTGGLADPKAGGTNLRTVAGGLLLQNRDNGMVTAKDLHVVTKRQPSDQEIADMLFAFRVAKHVKSNAIVYARDGVTVGIGAGQMSRVDSVRIAARKAQDAAQAAGWPAPRTAGSVVASDAFFPFADGLLSAVEAGARAVIQPGGSMRDAEVIAAADAHDIAMVMTGMRHFRH
ncbi:MAG: bifunctional phosphoribosylaminoimidazolecarboxamide formyltransferase/IMP cyclohydrolase [Sphingomonadales bacterium]